MITKCLSVKAAVALLFTGALLLLSSNLVYAGMCQIIRIDQTKGGGSARVEIFPEKVTVPVGTCTIWVNWVTDEKLHVSFRENAKQCIISTESPSGFEVQELKDGESCYFSDSLSKGKSASLYWKKSGLYKYTIEYANPSGGSGPTGSVKRAAVGVIEVK